MRDGDFEAKAKKRGYMRSGRATDNEATLGSCYYDTNCFGGGNHKPSTPAQPRLETLYKDIEQNFDLQPRTQLQFREPDV